MGFDLNALAGKMAIAKVDYMGQSALVTFDPNVLTAANINKMQNGDADFVEVFTSLITDWDVKRANKKVPLNAKGLEGIPVPFLRAVVRAINISGGGDEGEAVTSNAG